MSERVLTVGGNKASRLLSEFDRNIAGTEFYVGPNATGSGDDGRSGRSKETSLATLEAAISLATASKNDIIYLLPGHTETVATAGAISIDKIGLRVIGLGSGALRPTFTFSAVDATLTMTAASCVLENVIITPSIDSVVSPIVVSAADCKVDIELQDESATVECVCAVLTTADADRINVKVRHRGFIAGDACVNSVRLVGVDTAKVEVDFYGVASTSIVEFHTTACHDIDVSGKFYNDGTSLTKNVVDTVTGSTWSAQGWDGNSNANFSGGDNSAIASDDVTALASAISVIDAFHDVGTADAVTNVVMSDVVGNKTDAAAAGAVSTTESLMAYSKQLVGDIISVLADTGTDGVVIAADGITAAKIGDDAISEEHFDVDASMKMILGEVVNKTATTLPQTTATAQFTVAGGRVLVTSIVGEVTVIIQAQLNNAKLVANPTTGTSVDMCAALDITGDEVGCLYGITGTPADALVGTNAGLTPGMGIKGVVVNSGTIDLDCSANNTGETKWTLHYIPIDVGATVVAA